MRLRIALVLLFLLPLTLPAGAHANLVGASPAANTRFDAAPAEVRLTFTERVEPSFSAIRLLDLAGEEVLRGGIVNPADPFTMRLALSKDMPDGVYTVAWRVLSADDGHTTEGSYAFGIGMAAGTRAVLDIDESIRPEAAIARWLEMVGTALTLGVHVFAMLVWRPGALQGLPPRDTRFFRLMRAGWLIAGAGLLLSLLAQAANVSDGSIAGVVGDGSAMRLIATSGWGHVWLGRAAVWVAYGGVLTAARIRPALGGALFGLAIGIAVLPSLVSHARATGGMEAVLNDMLHRMAAALWVGGLAAWVTAIWPDLTLAAKPVGRAVTRFSNLARFYVLLLVLGGLFAAFQHVPTGDALLETAYGRALTVKGIVFGAMFLLAAVNLLFVERALRRGEEDAVAVLRLTISTEMVLGAALMVMSAVMASSIPSDDVLTLRAQAAEMAAAPHGEPFFGMEIREPVMMHFEVYPGIAGENEFIVSPFLLPDTTPIEDATRVRLRFSNLEQNLGESTLELAYDGQGNYIATGTNLSIPGNWRVRVSLQRPGAFDTVADFDVTIPLP